MLRGRGFGSFLGSILMLCDLYCFLSFVVWIVGNILDERIYQRVLIQSLGAYHHVSLTVSILTGNSVGHLLLVWSYLHVSTRYSPFLPGCDSLPMCGARTGCGAVRGTGVKC